MRIRRFSKRSLQTALAALAVLMFVFAPAISFGSCCCTKSSLLLNDSTCCRDTKSCCADETPPCGSTLDEIGLGGSTPCKPQACQCNDCFCKVAPSEWTIPGIESVLPVVLAVHSAFDELPWSSTTVQSRAIDRFDFLLAQDRCARLSRWLK